MVYNDCVHMPDSAHRVNVREARRNFRQLLEWVARGEEVVLLRREVEVGRIVGPGRGPAKLPDLTAFRKRIRLRGGPMSEAVINARRRERY